MFSNRRVTILDAWDLIICVSVNGSFGSLVFFALVEIDAYRLLGGQPTSRLIGRKRESSEPSSLLSLGGSLPSRVYVCFLWVCKERTSIFHWVAWIGLFFELQKNHGVYSVGERRKSIWGANFLDSPVTSLERNL